MFGSTFRDPEGYYFAARLLARLGDQDQALDLLQRACRGGFSPLPAFEDRLWDRVRDTPAFSETAAEAGARHAQARAAYRESGGERLLGPG